jgi:hypothetical protein
MRGDHPPSVNGLEFLAIFGRPRGPVKPSEEPTPALGIDTTPIGSIGNVAPADARSYAVVAAQLDFAWVRQGARVFAVRPGDLVPGLGRVGAITLREGRWTLIGDAGATLLSSAEPRVATDARAPFARRMIFGGEN